MKTNTRWFVRAIKIRKDSVGIFILSDRDYGGTRLVHELAIDHLGDYGYCQAEQGFRFKTKWLGIHYALYLDLLHNHHGIIHTMTLSQRQRDLFQTYLDNHEDTLNFAGNGQGRKLEIQAQMQDTVRVNIAQIEVNVMIAALAQMMIDAIG